MTRPRSTLALVLLGLGFAAALVSLVQTGLEVDDKAYVIPGLEDGDEHAQYHLAREAWMTLGILVVIAVGAFSPPAHRSPRLWLTIFAAVVAYLLGMWSGPYTQGELAHEAGPLFIHSVASIGLLAGAIILRKDFGHRASDLSVPPGERPR